MSPQFVPQPGTDWKTGNAPAIRAALDRLAKLVGKDIYGISGYRSPAHSVAVGGFANDPHTRGDAGDFGLGAPTKASAGGVTDAQLRAVGLYRPFPGAAEINHVQLLPGAAGAAKPAKGGGNRVSVGAGVAGGAAGGAALGTLIAPGLGTAIGAVGGAAAGGVGTLLQGPIQGAEQAAAKAAAQALLDAVQSSIAKDALRWALYAGLVIAGVALVFGGTTRTFGVGVPSPSTT